MLRVVLTGGIGTGKSVVLARFVDLGVPVVEADALAHAVIALGTPGAEAVRERFGAAVVTADGRIDRHRLGEVVFRDERARAELEAIIHPAVRRAIAAWMHARAEDGAELAVVEIPLLFETHREGDFDRIVVTACEPGEQLRRVMSRSGLARDDVQRRIAAQLPLDEKTSRADYVIWTDGRIEDTRRRATAVLEALRRDAGRLQP